MDAIKRLWWVAPAVLTGCFTGLWALEQVIFPESNGTIGALLGLILGGLGAQLTERLVGRFLPLERWQKSGGTYSPSASPSCDSLNTREPRYTLPAQARERRGSQADLGSSTRRDAND